MHQGTALPSLFVIQGRDQGKRFDVGAQPLRIGRDPGNDIRLHDTEVSRVHAELTLPKPEADFVLADLQSSNGTFVNGKRVEQQKLRNGDRILLGATLLIFTRPDELESPDVLDDVDIVSPRSDSQVIRSFSDSSLITPSPDKQWLARARSNLQVMYRTALAVSHTMDIDELLGRIMELIFEWVEADRGCILLLDAETGELSPKVRRNRPGVRAGDRMSLSRTILDYVIQHREGVLTSDAREDQRFDAAASILKLGTREAICVPMQGRYGIVGIIYVDTYTSPGKLLQQGTTNKFNEEHLKLMIAIGHQAALAVEDTSFYSAMVQAERLAAIGQTIAGLSHHVKNILQGIRGGSYLIEEGLNNDESDVVRKGWRIVEKNQEKISRLVLDMLTFSKEREPDLVEDDLNRVVSEIVELMQVRGEETQTQMLWQPDPELPRFCFDAEGIHHAVLNIVTNAMDACADVDQASVRISTSRDEHQRALITVSDTGPGIAAADLPRIFSMFFSNKGARGTGLGLTVSRKIVREHGGDIRVTSQPGAGSTFVVEIPIKFQSDDSVEIGMTETDDSRIATE